MFDDRTRQKYTSPYYNPLKNYGQGIPTSSAVSGPIIRYMEQQQQPKPDQHRSPQPA